MKSILRIVLSAALCGSLWAAQAPRSPEVQLKAAIHKEEVQGDLKGALDAYKKLAAGSNRAVAAQALLRAGQCYDKLGNAEARRMYERVIQDFKDQTDAVVEAQKRLTAPSMQSDSGPVLRKIHSARSGRTYGPSVSLDGRNIAFTERGQIRLLSLVTGAESLVLDAPSAGTLFSFAMISPNGKQVAFVEATPGASRIYVVNADGSGERLVTDMKCSPPACAIRPPVWSPDGTQLLGLITKYDPSRPPRDWNEGVVSWELLSFAVASGSSRLLLSGDQGGIGNAAFSPDGRKIAFPRAGDPPGSAGIYILSLDTGEVNLVVQSPALSISKPVWSPDGSRILFSTLRAGPMDLDLSSIRITAGKAEGEAAVVKKNVPLLLGVTRDDEYLYQASNSTRDLYLVDIDPLSGNMTSRPKQLTGQYDSRGAAWSPDGKYLAYFSIRAAGLPSLVIRSDQDGQEQVISPPVAPWKEALHFKPEWFSDSRSLLICHDAGKIGRFFIETSDFRPLLESIQVAGATAYPAAFAMDPDGKRVYYATRDQAGSGLLIVRQTFDTGTKTNVVQVGGAVSGLSLSPDGSQLAFIENAGRGAAERVSSLKVVPVSGGSHREIHRQAQLPMREVVWSRDGRRLFYSTNVNRFAGGKVIEEGGEIWTIPVEGGEPRRLGIGLQDEYFLSAHPNGSQLLFMDENFRNELWSIKNLFPAKK